jgi:hypothetical protein
VQATTKTTDEAGIVILANLPVGLYEIEVEANSTFQASLKTINIINEEHKDEITIFIGVKPRVDNDIEFLFSGKRFFGSASADILPDNLVIAKALLLPPQEGKGGALEDMDLEEYEFEIVWNK